MTVPVIALFGATGRTGRLVLAEAQRRGWPVRALVRDAGRLPAAPMLQVVVGDARDSGAIDDVLRPRGLDEGSGDTGGSAVRAVLCTLGMADITVPATDFSDSVRAIVAGMRRAGLRRLVAVASGVALPDAERGGYRGEHGTPDAYRHIAAEHMRNHRTLAQAGDEWGLAWTLMCPLNLVDDIAPGHARRAFEALPEGSGETSMADLAAAMCDLVDDAAAIGHRVGIVSDRAAAAAAAATKKSP
ncbi:MAG: NAD(P)H-binding protein [Rubrivivax sp.]|nr:NAD(P)H-binding protein [Rubrivivax sp.]